jgi:PRTRC genetic system protein F
VYAGTRLEWLERRYAGTGRAVLGALARASGAGFRLMMPHHVFAMCQRLHWQDAEDERCMAEECAAEDEAYDGPTREQWRRHAPDWALSWSIAKARPGPRTPRGIGAAIAGVDAAIRGMRKGKPLLEITEGDYADQDAFTHWILWRGGALEERVVDDWFQEVWNTGEVLEHFAERHVEQPEALLAALDTLQPALALYRAVDALLDACRLPRG